MTLQFIYWLIMLLWLLGGVYTNRTAVGNWVLGNVALFILFLIIGLRLFGQPIHG